MDKLIRLRHLLHQNAELSLKENRTREIIKGFIRENTDLEPIEKDGNIYAVYKGRGGKAIALRADFDALPIAEEGDKPYSSAREGVSHRCGHDGHTAALCGAMLNIVKSGCKNRVIFVFQCGEEIGVGGKKAAEAIKELKADRVYGWHNIPGYKLGEPLIRENTFCCGSRGIIVTFMGRSAHAAYPEAGISPQNAVRGMLEHIDRLNAGPSKGLLHCTLIGIDCGGENFGVAAYKARLMATLRGEYSEEYEGAVRGFTQRAEQLARGEGLGCKIEFRDVFPATENSLAAVRTLKEVCRERGLGFLMPDEPFRWSEDFGYYTKDTEGCFFGIGAGEEQPQLHTDKYDFPDEILGTAADLLTCLAQRED